MESSKRIAVAAQLRAAAQAQAASQAAP
jgi:hypothetical protein